MTTDFLLAGAHHLLVFSMMAVLAVELALVRPGLAGAALSRLARLDGAYGGLAIAVVLVGAGRVLWGLKGWEAYSGNVWFWHKMGAFAIVGLLSIMPTMRFLRWRRSAAADPAYAVPAAEIGAVRRVLHVEAGLFLLIPVFAAAMARFGA